MNWNILVTIEKIKRDSVSNDEWTWKLGYKKSLNEIYIPNGLKKPTLKGYSPVGYHS